MKRYSWLVFLLLALGVAFLPAVAAPATVKVGVGCPLTGPLAKVGRDILNGVKLAVEESNTAGGVLGKRVEIITGDDKGDPKEGILVANKLVSDGVVGVIGHYNSGVSIPASREVYSPARVVMISPASTNPVLTDKGTGWVFRTVGRDDQQGMVAAQFVLKKKFRRVVVLHDKTQYGQGLAEEFQKVLEGKGLQPLLFDAITAGDKDFRSILTRIKGLSPDVLYFGGYYQEGALLVKQAHEIGLKATFFSGDAVYDQMFTAVAGLTATGSYLTFPRAVRAEKFLKDYRSKFGVIGPYSGYAYDAARILMAAIMRAGSLDAEKIRAEVAGTKRFPGVTGNITFNSKGDITRLYYIVWVVDADGNFVPAK